MANLKNIKRLNSLLLLGVVSFSLLVVGCQKTEVEETTEQTVEATEESVEMTDLTAAEVVEESLVTRTLSVENNSLKIVAEKVQILSSNGKITAIKIPVYNNLEQEKAIFGDSFGQIFNIVLNDDSTIKGFNSEKVEVNPLESGIIVINIEDQEESFVDNIKAIYISNLYKSNGSETSERILYPLFVSNATDSSYDQFYNELNKSDE